MYLKFISQKFGQGTTIPPKKGGGKQHHPQGGGRGKQHDPKEGEEGDTTCAPTNSGTFHKPKYEMSVDFSGTAAWSGSRQHVSMRDVDCKVSKVF